MGCSWSMWRAITIGNYVAEDTCPEVVKTKHRPLHLLESVSSLRWASSVEMFLRTYAKWIDGEQNELEMQRMEMALLSKAAPPGEAKWNQS